MNKLFCKKQDFNNFSIFVWYDVNLSNHNALNANKNEKLYLQLIRPYFDE